MSGGNLSPGKHGTGGCSWWVCSQHCGGKRCFFEGEGFGVLVIGDSVQEPALCTGILGTSLPSRFLPCRQPAVRGKTLGKCKISPTGTVKVNHENEGGNLVTCRLWGH